MELIDRFLRFEEERRLFDLRIRGVYFWSLIRFSVYMKVQSQTEKLGTAHHRKSTLDMFGDVRLLTGTLWNCLRHNPLCLRKEKEILFYNHSRRVLNDGYFECLYTDSIISALDVSSQSIELPYLMQHYKPAKTQHIVYADMLLVLAGICKRFMKKLSAQEAAEIESVFTSLSVELGVSLNAREWLYRTADWINQAILFERYYEKILRRVKPKLIVETVSYDWAKQILNGTAKKLGIPTVELQHGTMGRDHVAYNFSSKRDLPYFPDYLFIFGDYWADVTRLPVGRRRIKAVGWPYYENKLRAAHREKAAGLAKRAILFLSQGTIGRELSRVAVDLAGMIDRGKVDLIYKLHPGEYNVWKTNYPWLDGSGVHVIDNNQHDLHHYFVQSNVQVGVSSTALFEGLGYGLQTIVFPFSGYERLMSLVENGSAYLAHNAKDLLLQVESERQQAGFDLDYYWKSNSLENCLTAIQEIIHGAETDGTPAD